MGQSSLGTHKDAAMSDVIHTLLLTTMVTLELLAKLVQELLRPMARRIA